MYYDAYAHKYQKINGFRIHVKAPENEEYIGYLSLKPSTRSTYDIAMRDATIDGLITMDDIDKLEPGQIFYREVQPKELYILQSVNEFEHQKNTRNINAIKQNSYVTVQRKQYNDETEQEEYMDIYKNVISFVTMQNKDEKNFAAGVEDNTFLNIQIPKRDVEGKLYVINNGDRVILSNLKGDLSREIKVESMNEFGVPGVVIINGTFETRTGD
jgi:hypothetical protein